ncbi:acyltransferase [Imperialibacter roseus]|uniref:Acyltransferase n=1 Tax=Imperialibacter roseus TaxID=1324217 RepID=A0ABZ0IP44_9BACT|nr:acyltransferase [Imperialibacter roseus]WOK06282.1 acyltransferase [Imperialibacter roseus]
MLRFILRAVRFLYRIVVYRLLAGPWNWLMLKSNKVAIGQRSTINGFISVECAPGSVVSIGTDFRVNSGSFFNNIGRQQQTSLICREGGLLTIGDNVGISASTIVCHESVTIGSNVRFGGNCVVYDTDFHSLKAAERTSLPENKSNISKRPVSIGDNAFIGAHSTLLKGTIVGENSIIGACSVVRGATIPANEVWAGNPAVFIKRLNT